MPAVPLPAPLHPITLNFRDRTMEARYREASLPALRRHCRIAIGVGLLLYALSSLLDRWFVPAGQLETVAILRWVAMGPAVATFFYTFTPWFRRVNSIPLALVGAYAAAGILVLLSLGDEAGAMYYSAAMILVTLFTYSFVGARFIHALTVNLALLGAYNLLFATLDPYPLRLVLGHDFFILCANVIGAFDAYLGEAQRRMLFLRERELDDERRHHLERSLHDALTGLPNRELLHDRLEQALSRAQREGRGGLAVFIDLDDFKPINDTFGHEAGDSVLCAVAERLLRAVRETDTVARLGGDEFFVVAGGIATTHDARVFSEAIAAALAVPIELPGGRSIARVGASLGLCAFPYSNATPGDIIRRADLAMYSAKRNGTGAEHYNADVKLQFAGAG